MAVAVVAIHTQPFYGCEKTWWYAIYDYFVALAVPFFFLVSAFFLFKKLESASLRNEKLMILKKYCFRVLRLYVIWTVIYLPVTLYDFVTRGDGVAYTVFRFIRNFLFVGQQWYSWPLWYLLASAYASAFIYVLLKLKIKEHGLVFASVAVFLFSYLITWLCNNYDSYTGVLFYIGKVLYTFFANGRVFQGIGYFGICYALVKTKRKLSTLTNVIIVVSCCVASVLLAFSGITFSDTPLIVIAAVSLFEIAFSFVTDGCRHIAIQCRNMSTVIYFTHMILYFLLGLFWLGFEESLCSGMTPFIAVSFITICLSLILVKLKGRKIGIIFGW